MEQFFEYLEPKQDTIVKTIPFLPQTYTFSLKMKVLDITRHQLMNVLHFTTAHNKNDTNYVLPAIFIYENKLRISQDVNSEVMHGTNIEFEPNRWIFIVVSSIKRGSTYWYTVTVNGKTVENKIDKSPHSYKNVTLYVSDPWHVAANVVIRDFSISFASKYEHRVNTIA